MELAGRVAIVTGSAAGIAIVEKLDGEGATAVQRSLAEMDRRIVPPLVPAEEIAEIVLELIRDDSAPGRVVVRWAHEEGSRVLA